MHEEEEHHRKLLERISMFNDAVYAIVITLLVLELHIPELKNKSSLPELIAGIREMQPKLLAFLLNVLLVGGNWIGSVNLQRVLVKSNEACVVLSITYLIIISLFPFSCDIIGSYPDNPGSYLIFGILSVLMTTNAYTWMRIIWKNNYLHKNADHREWEKLMNALPVIIIYLAAVSLSALISTKLSFILFLITNLLPFFFTRPFKIKFENE